MQKYLIVGVVVVVLLVGGYFGADYIASLKEEPRKSKPPTARKFVQTKRVVYQDISTDIVSFGRVQSAQPLELITEVSGRIKANVPLKAGQRFSKGQLLFQIDDTEARLAL
ncbi:MAG: efflux transporter periplasmic adaptor subunit, partial [Bacteroidota bacterium]